jgi:isopentenyldiphosphate isomerase
MDEMLDIVDENDNIIGKDTKENKLKNNLITRNVVIFVLDNENRILIAKRSPTKKSFPNRYDLAACGNVKAGETYKQAAKRELKEELSIEINLKFLKKIFNEFEEKGNVIKYFTGIFLGLFSGEVKLNEEFTELKRMNIEEIQNLIDKNQDLFTPGLVRDFREVKNMLN